MKKSQISAITSPERLLLIIIVLAAFLLRFVNLDRVPIGLTNDEANYGYDAYSILLTGKDQWGQTQPAAYLRGFGDYRLPVNTYITTLAVKLFGLNEFSVRIPAAVFGTLGILGCWVLVRKLFGKKPALFAAIFLSVNPWHLGMSRFANESILAVFFTSAALYFLVRSDFPKKSYWYIGILFLILSIYTYTSYLIVAPLLLAACIILNLHTKTINSRTVYISLLVFVLLLLPLFFSGGFKTATTRSRQVNLTHDVGIVNTVNDKRGACDTRFPDLVCRIFLNKYITYLYAYFNNLSEHLSPQLLLIYGFPNQLSVMPPRGILFLTEFIFFCLGIAVILKSKNIYLWFLAYWLVVAAVPDSFTGVGHFTRFMPVLPVMQIIAAIGLAWAWQNRKLNYLVLGMMIFFAYEITTYQITYWTYFPEYFARQSHYGYRELLATVNRMLPQYDRVIFSSRVNDTKQYIYFLFYNRIDPAVYQSRRDVTFYQEANDWIRVDRIGKMYFLPNIALPEYDQARRLKILLVGAPEEFPKKVIPEETVKDPLGNIIFSIVDLNRNISLFYDTSKNQSQSGK